MTNQNEQQQWFILINEQKFGPYDYRTMISLIQQNQLMDYNFVWAPHLESWTPLHKLTEFSKPYYEQLLKSDLKNVFHERKNPRTEVSLQIVGHNHKRFFDGFCTSISEQGGLFLLNSPLVQIGEKVKLHIKSQDFKPKFLQTHEPHQFQGFNIEGEIIRKNYSKERINAKSGLYYAVKFIDMQPMGLELINTWVLTHPQAA